MSCPDYPTSGNRAETRAQSSNDSNNNNNHTKQFKLRRETKDTYKTTVKIIFLCNFKIRSGKQASYVSQSSPARKVHLLLLAHCFPRLSHGKNYSVL